MYIASINLFVLLLLSEGEEKEIRHFFSLWVRGGAREGRRKGASIPTDLHVRDYGIMTEGAASAPYLPGATRRKRRPRRRRRRNGHGKGGAVFVVVVAVGREDLSPRAAVPKLHEMASMCVLFCVSASLPHHYLLLHLLLLLL